MGNLLKFLLLFLEDENNTDLTKSLKEDGQFSEDVIEMTCYA